MRLLRLLLAAVLLAILSPPTARAAEMVSNGGLEGGYPVTSGTCLDITVTYLIDSWTPGPGGVRWCRQVSGVTIAGERSVDLNRGTNSSISQTLAATTVGTPYVLSFVLDINDVTCGGTPTSGGLTVNVAGRSQAYTATTIPTTHLLGFAAASTSTTLEFKSTTSASCGPVIDSVSVVPLDCATDTHAVQAAAGATVTGTAGDDLICGSSGAETLDGGAGSDILVGLGGDDTLTGGADGDLLLGGDGKDIMAGDTGADQLFGGADAASDRMSGGISTGDTFDIAGTTPVADPGIDRVDYNADGRGAGVTVTMDNAANDGAAGENDNVSTEVESVTGTPYADVLTGDSVAGLAGDSHTNTFAGLASADTLTGNDGPDFLVGGAGGDQLLGGAGSDHVSYHLVGTNAGYNTFQSGKTLTRAVAVDLDASSDDGTCTGIIAATGCTTGVSEGDRVYQDIEYVYGGNGNDTINLKGYTGGVTGNPPATAGVVAFGYGGNDTLVGTTGNDFLEGGDGTTDIGCGKGGTDIFVTVESINPASCSTL